MYKYHTKNRDIFLKHGLLSYEVAGIKCNIKYNFVQWLFNTKHDHAYHKNYIL